VGACPLREPEPSMFRVCYTTTANPDYS
jgi:hypothetical protein